MYKIIYLPTCEEVQLHSYPKDKESLLKLFTDDSTTFFRDRIFKDYPDSGRIKPMWNTRFNNDFRYYPPIPKHLFEIIEVDNV